MSQDDDIQLFSDETDRPRNAGAPAVAISQQALADMEQHAAQDLRHELAGLLLGTVLEGDGQTLVRAEVAIPAQHIESRRGSVTFTHDTWAHLNKVKDRDYPDKRIIGWYHTHPSFGIFLSEYDLFIQRNFFTAPWQVAYVTDPVGRESGCFVWKGEQIEKTDDYEVYAAASAGLQMPAVSETVQLPLTPPVTSRRPRMSLLTAAVLGIAGLVLGMQIALLLALYGPPEGSEPTPVVVRSPAPTITVEEELPPPPATEARAQVEAESYYVVQPGDSLWRIAQKHYDGHGELWPFIAKANGLDLGGSLEPGMRLQIPPMSEIYSGE